MRFKVSPGLVVYKKIKFFQIIFSEVCLIDIRKPFQTPAILSFKVYLNPTILLVHFFKKNPGNQYTNNIYFVKKAMNELAKVYC